jgi:RNA polymerase sigma-70 factor (ECF subfamily)
VQDTLLRASMRLHFVRSADSIVGWLCTIQLNLFRNNLQRRDVMTRTPRLLDSSFDPDTVCTSRGPGAALSPEDSAICSEQNALTIRALSTLLGASREAIVLCEVRGNSYQAIAHHTGVQVGTVRSRIHRGRKMLRESLAAWHRVP